MSEAETTLCGVPQGSVLYINGIYKCSSLFVFYLFADDISIILKKLDGVCGTLPETLTLFQTKICDFQYPISDLIKNLIPYFRPGLIIISSLGQTNVKGNVYILLLIRTRNSTISFVIPHYNTGCIMRRHRYRIRAYLTLI